MDMHNERHESEQATLDKLYSDILRDEKNAKREHEEAMDTRFQDWPPPPQE